MSDHQVELLRTIVYVDMLYAAEICACIFINVFINVMPKYILGLQ